MGEGANGDGNDGYAGAWKTQYNIFVIPCETRGRNVSVHPNALDLAIASTRPGIERLTVDQFHRMIESGILGEGQPIELIDGILVRKDSSDAGGDPMAHGPMHAYCIQRLKELETNTEPRGFHLRQQLPITISRHHEPEPDVAIVRGAMEDYRDRHPVAADCALVVEVSDSSLEYDRTVKGPIYASADIPLYWIVNIKDCRQLEVYERPEQGVYTRRTDFNSGDCTELYLGLDARIAIRIESILP